MLLLDISALHYHHQLLLRLLLLFVFMVVVLIGLDAHPSTLVYDHGRNAIPRCIRHRSATGIQDRSNGRSRRFAGRHDHTDICRIPVTIVPYARLFQVQRQGFQQRFSRIRSLDTVCQPHVSLSDCGSRGKSHPCSICRSRSLRGHPDRPHRSRKRCSRSLRSILDE